MEYGMIINGKDVFANEKWEDHSPVNTYWILARLQKGTATHAQQAIAAARKAFPAWSRTPWQERVKLVRKAAANLNLKRGRVTAAQMDVYDSMRLVEKPNFTQRIMKFFKRIGFIR
jgi:1-pyrroline-5-carboxylate dehydrogenase